MAPRKNSKKNSDSSESTETIPMENTEEELPDDQTINVNKGTGKNKGSTKKNRKAEKTPTKVGVIDEVDLREASTSNGRKSNRSKNKVQALFTEENDHVDMEIEGMDEEFLSESEEDFSSDDDIVSLWSAKNN